MGDEFTAVRSARMTRRTVLRVGAGAAWAVPAVTLLAAAPAAARCSHHVADISSSTATATAAGNVLTLNTVLANTGGAATEPWVEVAFTPVDKAFAWSDAGTVPEGWIASALDRRRVAYRLAAAVPAGGVVLATFTPTADVEGGTASVGMQAVGADAECGVEVDARQTVVVA